MEWKERSQTSPRRGQMTSWQASDDAGDWAGVVRALTEFWKKLFAVLDEAGQEATAPPGWDVIYCHMQFDSGMIVCYPARKNERKRVDRIDASLALGWIERQWHELSGLSESEYNQKHSALSHELRRSLADSISDPSVAADLQALKAKIPFEIIVMEYEDTETGQPI